MANRMILGSFNGDHVLRVSRPEHNVLNPNLARKNLAFDSQWPETMQVIHSDRVSYPASSTANTFSIPHGGLSLSTGAVVLMWLEWGGYMYRLNAQGVGVSHTTFQGWSTNSHIQVYRQHNGPNPLVSVHIQFVTLRQSNG